MEAEEKHFEVKDFAGRTIICTELQWEDHVCGRRDHLYMEGAEKEVIEALQSPDYGIRHFVDVDHPNRRAYYKLSWTKDYYIKVIVQFDDKECNSIGRVHTAYMPEDITPGDKPEINV
jgi:hypothetical protein